MSVIKNFVAKLLFKKRGAIANNKAVEFSTKDVEQRLRKFNIDPNTIKSEGELKQALNFVQQAEDQAFTERFGNMLQGSRFGKSADVLDMTGKKLDPNKPIMGGTQTTEETIKENLMKTDNPFSELVKATEKGPKSLADRLPDIDKSLRDKKVPTTFSEDIKRQYGLELTGDETVQEVIDMISDINKNKKDFATGGRAGYRFGLGPLFNFLNKKSPAKAYTDYLKSVKDRMKAGKEAEVAGEVIPIAATGALITNQLKKKLKAMNEEEKKKIRKEAMEELKKDMEKRADGGRAGFVGGGAAKKLAEQIIKKYKGKIDDKLLNQMLVDDNPQRLAEVMATIDEALIMQNKGMGPDEIVGTIKSSLERKKQATGGRAGFANGGEGLMSLADKQIESLGPDAPSILLRPRASGVRREQQIAPGVNLSERDISYGISGILQGDKFYGGASLDKGKVKFDVETEDGQTLFKDTIAKDDALNFILGMGDPKGEKDKFQIKFDDDLENLSLILKKSFADGGRANFDKGGMSRRKFMKIMGGLAALPIVGKFFKGAKPAAKVADVVTKTTKATQPPEYFFDLAAKIKILGKESSVARQERMVEVNYKNYTLEEDLVTGDMTIVKRKGDPEFGYEEEVMSLRKGQADEMTKGRTPNDEYEELTVRPDPEGKMKDVEDGIEPSSVKEIMEEVGQGGGNLDQRTLEEIARGRLASGGVAMMLGDLLLMYNFYN